MSTNREERSRGYSEPQTLLPGGTCLRGSGVQTREGGLKKKQYSSFVALRFPWSLPRSFPLSELAGGLPLMWSIIINRVYRHHLPLCCTVYFCSQLLSRVKNTFLAALQKSKLLFRLFEKLDCLKQGWLTSSTDSMKPLCDRW